MYRSLSCSVPVSEAFEGWKASACVALCIDCNVLQLQTDDDQEVVFIKDCDLCDKPVTMELYGTLMVLYSMNPTVVTVTVILLLSARLVDFMKFWKPKDHQNLEIAIFLIHMQCALRYKYLLT